MGLFKKLFGTNSIDEKLIGVWESDSTDTKGIGNFGNVRMTFELDGNLTYEIVGDTKTQRMKLVFFTENDTIVTDQPSQPKVERSKYFFETESILVIEFGGEKSKYIKIA